MELAEKQCTVVRVELRLVSALTSRSLFVFIEMPSILKQLNNCLDEVDTKCGVKHFIKFTMFLKR